MENLVRQGTWELVLEDDIPPGLDITSEYFVIAIEDTETDKPMFKERISAHVHRDAEKLYSFRQSSARLLIALAAIKRFDVWTKDVSNAYLQPARKPLHEVNLRPNKHIEVASTVVWTIRQWQLWACDFHRVLEEESGLANCG